jgi:hypothetical protein
VQLGALNRVLCICSGYAKLFTGQDAASMPLPRGELVSPESLRCDCCSKDALCGCQIGPERPVPHAKQDQQYPSVWLLSRAQLSYFACQIGPTVS